MDDAALRLMAFSEVERRVMAFGRPLLWEQIIPTFEFAGHDIYLANRARGIFKPRQMQRGVLSVKTTVPREGRDRRYIPDRRDESLIYSFQGNDANSSDNQRLRESFEDRSPFIYFYGVAPGKYEPLWPACIAGWNPEKLTVEIQISPRESATGGGSAIGEDERRYRTHQAKQRVHQAAFRELVLDAYGGRCALTGFPVRPLLNAAHIFPDGHLLGIPSVNNGIALSTLHHGAYDSNLIGISPDGIIHVSDRLFEETDGPLLEQGLKALKGGTMRFPAEPELRPDKNALAYRFEGFRSAC